MQRVGPEKHTHADQSDILNSQADFTLVAFVVIAQRKKSQSHWISCRR